jgi:hypothetical protein
MTWNGTTGRYVGTTVNTTEPTHATTATFTDTGNAATNRNNLEADINAVYASGTGNHCILIPAGTNFAGRITLNANVSGFWVTVKTAAHASLPAASDGTSCGTKTNRVAFADSTNMPKFWPTSINSSPFLVPDGAGKLYLRGLYFANNVGFTSDAVGGIETGWYTRDVIVAQCVARMASTGGSTSVRRAFYMAGGRHAVVDCYADQIGDGGADSQFVLFEKGAGPFKFTNNHSIIGGVSENVMCGGGDLPGTDNVLQPQNIDIRGNVCDKPSWGNHKNHIEIKLGIYVLIADNLCLDHNGLGQQNSIVLKVAAQGGTNPESAAEHITVTGNKLAHPTNAMPGGIVITGREGWGGDYALWLKRMRNVVVMNNVVRVDAGRCITLGDDCFDLDVQYNTLYGAASNSVFWSQTGSPPMTRLSLRWNVMSSSDDPGYIVFANGGTVGNNAVAAFTASSTFTDNLISCGAAESRYTGNTRVANAQSAIGFVNLAGGDLTLSSSSAGYQAAPSSKDMGSNITLFNARMAEVN